MTGAGGGGGEDESNGAGGDGNMPVKQDTTCTVNILVVISLITQEKRWHHSLMLVSMNACDSCCHALTIACFSSAMISLNKKLILRLSCNIAKVLHLPRNSVMKFPNYLHLH